MATNTKFQDKLINEKASQLTFEQIIQEITITESELAEVKAQKEFSREVLKHKMETSEDPSIVRSEKVEDGMTFKQMTMDINDYNVSYGDYKRTNFNKDIVLDTAKTLERLVENDLRQIQDIPVETFEGFTPQQIKDHLIAAEARGKSRVTSIINSFASATTTTLFDRLDIGYNKKKK